MKKKVLITSVIVGLLVSNIYAYTNSFSRVGRNDALGITVIKDNSTEVQYILSDNGGICVRVDSNGRLMTN